jgi:hypothetical protein
MTGPLDERLGRCQKPGEFMNWIKGQPERGQLPRRIIAGVGLAVYLFTANPTTFAQAKRSTDHWVGTWATAVVARVPP